MKLVVFMLLKMKLSKGKLVKIWPWVLLLGKTITRKNNHLFYAFKVLFFPQYKVFKPLELFVFPSEKLIFMFIDPFLRLQCLIRDYLTFSL